MRKTVTYKEEVEKKTTVTICDKCGFEAEEPHNLFSRKQVMDYHAQAFPDYEPLTVYRGRQAVYQVSKEQVRTILNDLVSMDRALTVCGDCYQEMFGWLQ